MQYAGLVTLVALGHSRLGNIRLDHKQALGDVDLLISLLREGEIRWRWSGRQACVPSYSTRDIDTVYLINGAGTWSNLSGCSERPLWMSNRMLHQRMASRRLLVVSRLLPVACRGLLEEVYHRRQQVFPSRRQVCPLLQVDRRRQSLVQSTVFLFHQLRLYP